MLPWISANVSAFRSMMRAMRDWITQFSDDRRRRYDFEAGIRSCDDYAVRAPGEGPLVLGFASPFDLTGLEKSAQVCPVVPDLAGVLQRYPHVPCVSELHALVVDCVQRIVDYHRVDPVPKVHDYVHVSGGHTRNMGTPTRPEEQGLTLVSYFDNSAEFLLQDDVTDEGGACRRNAYRQVRV
jgi:hypothetical protein